MRGAPLRWRASAASYLRETAEGLKRRPAWARLSAACLLGFVIASPFSISLSQIFVFTAIGAWLVSLRLEGRAARFPLWKPFTFFAALTLLSAALSDDPARSLVDAKQLFEILIFYCALNIASEEREGLRWVKALVAVSAAVSVYALAAALTRPIGLDNRMSGFFSHYMTLGGYLTLAGALAFAYVAMARGAGSRWMGGAGALIIAALMTTLSRNAWLGFAAAALCATIAARSIRGGAILAVVVALALVLSPPLMRERVLSIGNLEDPTVKERVYMWESGLNMVRDRPLFGTGLDMIKRTYTRYAKPEALKKHTGHLHNNALHIAAERGVPALAAWLWIMGAFFWPPSGG